MVHDWNLPLRSTVTGRRVYVNWHEWSGPKRGLRWVSLRDGSGKTGFPYAENGTPIEENPMGELENFEPDENPFEEIVDVGTAEEQRARVRERAELEAQMGDSPMFGMF